MAIQSMIKLPSAAINESQSHAATRAQPGSTSFSSHLASVSAKHSATGEKKSGPSAISSKDQPANDTPNSSATDAVALVSSASDVSGKNADLNDQGSEGLILEKQDKSPAVAGLDESTPLSNKGLPPEFSLLNAMTDAHTTKPSSQNSNKNALPARLRVETTSARTEKPVANVSSGGSQARGAVTVSEEKDEKVLEQQKDSSPSSNDGDHQRIDSGIAPTAPDAQLLNSQAIVLRPDFGEKQKELVSANEKAPQSDVSFPVVQTTPRASTPVASQGTTSALHPDPMVAPSDPVSAAVRDVGANPLPREALISVAINPSGNFSPPDSSADSLSPASNGEKKAAKNESISGALKPEQQAAHAQFLSNFEMSLSLGRKLTSRVAKNDADVSLVSTSSAFGAPAATVFSPQSIRLATPVTNLDWSRAFAVQVAQSVAEVHSVSRGLTSAQQSIELRVNPPDLGPVRIEISVSNGAASAVFSSHSAAVRDAISQALPDLGSNLAQQGLTLGQTSVNDESRSFQAGQFLGEHQQRKPSSFTGQDAHIDTGAEATTDGASDIPEKIITSGLIRATA